MDNQPAGPPFKFPGGKTQLLWRLTKVMPKTIACLWEPFLGGGALFWSLSQPPRYRKAVLSDANPELVRTWRAIQRNWLGIARELDKHVHTKRHYLAVRAQDPRKLSDEKTAARFLYLNRAGYNGMVRYNRAGGFNIPFGDQKKMLTFADPARLKACARVLNERPVTIVEGDFEQVTRKVRLGDAVYVDPPYCPASKTASFTAYCPGGFNHDDQVRLSAWFRQLDERGIAALASNARVDAVERLYAGMHIEGIAAKRAINSDATKRGDVKEVLIFTRALLAAQGRR